MISLNHSQTGDETMTAATDTIKRSTHGSHQTRPDFVKPSSVPNQYIREPDGTDPLPRYE